MTHRRAAGVTDHEAVIVASLSLATTERSICFQLPGTRRCIVKWSVAQVGLLIICSFHVIQAVIGLIIEPSFATGADAQTVQLLGMDYNGWHAVAGLALFLPGLVFSLRKSWAVLYLILAAISGAIPGIWAFFSHRVAYVFTFPHNVTDGVVHLLTAAIMLAVAAVQIRLDGGLRDSLADLRRTP